MGKAKDKILKAAEVRRILGYTDRQLGVRRSQLGKGEQHQHGYSLGVLMRFVDEELKELDKRKSFLHGARKKLEAYVA
jgi:hypothetical protein